jgi:hypothetical protein
MREKYETFLHFLGRHQKRRARIQHHLIQKLKKNAKTFRIFLALQIVLYVKILLVYGKSIVDFIFVISLA